jgi:hypothetical protein
MLRLGVLQVSVRCAMGLLSALFKSTTYLSRLETRTKKSSSYASHWVQNLLA